MQSDARGVTWFYFHWPTFVLQHCGEFPVLGMLCVSCLSALWKFFSHQIFNISHLIDTSSVSCPAPYCASDWPNPNPTITLNLTNLTNLTNWGNKYWPIRGTVVNNNNNNNASAPLKYLIVSDCQVRWSDCHVTERHGLCACKHACIVLCKYTKHVIKILFNLNDE